MILHLVLDYITFSSRDNLICQKNTLWKVNEIIPKSKIVWTEAAGNTERKTLQPFRPWKIYQNRETPSDTGRFEWSYFSIRYCFKDFSFSFYWPSIKWMLKRWQIKWKIHLLLKSIKKWSMIKKMTENIKNKYVFLCMPTVLRNIVRHLVSDENLKTHSTFIWSKWRAFSVTLKERIDSQRKNRDWGKSASEIRTQKRSKYTWGEFLKFSKEFFFGVVLGGWC